MTSIIKEKLIGKSKNYELLISFHPDDVLMCSTSDYSVKLVTLSDSKEKIATTSVHIFTTKWREFFKGKPFTSCNQSTEHVRYHNYRIGSHKPIRSFGDICQECMVNLRNYCLPRGMKDLPREAITRMRIDQLNDYILMTHWHDLMPIVAQLDNKKANLNADITEHKKVYEIVPPRLIADLKGSIDDSLKKMEDEIKTIDETLEYVHKTFPREIQERTKKMLINRTKQTHRENRRNRSRSRSRDRKLKVTIRPRSRSPNSRRVFRDH